MKKAVLLLLVIAGILTLVACRTADPQGALAALSKRGVPLRPGGELHYRLYLFGILPVAEAQLKKPALMEHSGRPVIRLSAAAKALPAYAGLVKASGEFTSLIDPSTHAPLIFTQTVVTSKGRMDKDVTYDQRQGTMSIAGVERQILPNTHDPLSLFFNLARTRLDGRHELEYNINTNQKNYIFAGRVRPRPVNIGGASQPGFVLSADIRRRDKNPYHKSNVRIFFLAGEENIPVIIRVFASGGLVYARLVDIK